MATERTPEHLVRDLRSLGVNRGDLLMIHASLRKVGPVSGGAAGVLDALSAAVGDAGTLLMVLGSRNDWAWVDEQPEDDRPGLLADAEPFDCLATPADPEVGMLAEVFRTRRGTVVSDHPEGRFAAAGRLAAELVSDVPWNDYYGAGSPLERFVEASGRVLRLGADLNTVTLLHYAEYLVPLPAKRRVRRLRLVTTPSGPEVRLVDTLDDSEGIVDYPAEDYFTAIMREYLNTGAGLRGRVGDADGELLESADLIEFGVAWMAAHLS